ncbi:hypothetical protein, partial [Pseudomonas mosselii]
PQGPLNTLKLRKSDLRVAFFISAPCTVTGKDLHQADRVFTDQWFQPLIDVLHNTPHSFLPGIGNV